MRRPRHRNLNRLWIARKRIGLGQKSVARLLGHKCTSPISNYENGRLVPSLRTALKLAIIYQTPLPDLYITLQQQLEEEVEAIRNKVPIAHTKVQENTQHV